ncbi:MAG: protein kinase [Chthoniobacterales bacterium]
MNSGRHGNSEDPDKRRTVTPDSGGSTLVCPSCGARLEQAGESPLCPACLLKSSLEAGGGAHIQVKRDPSDPASESKGLAVPSRPGHHLFAHFEVETGPDGKPVQLGEGAMGVTYKAMDTLLRRPVALKVIASRLLDNESLKARFIKEARAAASLRHLNIASVFYLGSTESSYFYAMELVVGTTLEEIIATRAPLDVTLALDITAQVASALAAAHQAGLVHRDIKPANLIVSFDDKNRATVKVIDFGLVKVTAEVSAESSASEAGIFLGTPRYASPEQFGAGEVDIRSDIYALGIILWEMLTGATPFSGSTAQVAAQHLQASLPMRKVRYVPRPVVALLIRLLEKDPSDRPQTPEELLTILEGTIRAPGVPQGIFPSEKIRISRPTTRIRKPRGKTSLGRRIGRKLFLEPWDFTPLLVEKLRGFTGREWLFQEIEEWRAKGPTPVLLLVGEPGMGKSAIIAALIHRNPGDRVLAYHCCRADTPATLEPAGFVRGLAAMLAARLDEYGAMLEGATIANFLQRSDTDPVSAFEAAILGPLHNIQQPEEGRSYLLIDSLDEALTRVHRPTILDVLATRIDRLPSWLGIVATTRNDPNLLSQLRGLRAHVLSAEDPRNQDDVRRYIQSRLAESILRDKAKAGGKTPVAIVDDLLKSSAGNFLFVTTALDAVESGQLSFDQIENLPPGLSCLYEIFFHRLFRDAGVDFGVSRQVLETVVAAREPLTREQIAAATGLDAEQELPPILARLASFVPASQGLYAIFHRSLSDWLTGWDIQQDQPFAGSYHVNLQKGWIRLANWCWSEYQRGSQNTSSYCLRHLASHLHQVGRDNLLGSVLRDFSFLQGKLEATDAGALIADYEYLPETNDLRLVQSALRLSAHVLARDHGQLAGQLTGRLLGNPAPDIQVLLRGAAGSKSGPWLCPLTPSLAPPGGALIRTLEGHLSWVHAVALTSDGRFAISGSGDGTLRVWDLESNRSARILAGHTGPVSAVAISPNDRLAVSASSDSTLRVWDLESGQSLRALEGHRSPVFSVAITPDGRYAVSASGVRTQRVWAGKPGQRTRIASGSASPDRTLRVWDLESGQLVRTLAGHADWINAVALTPDGHCAISASSDHTLRVWDLESGRLVRTLTGHTDSVNAVAVTPEGDRAVSASSDHMLRVWNLKNARSERILEGHTGWVTTVLVTLDGRRAISGSADHTLRLWDLTSGQSVRILEGHTNSVTAVVLMPDGRRAISGSPDHTLRVWDLKTGQSLRTLAGHTDWVTAIVVTPDGRRAVSGSADHTLRMWDLERGQSGHTLAGQTDSITAVVLMPDGRRAAVASDYHLLRIWDLESGQLLEVLPGHTDWITAVAVTGDGRRVISASADRTLRVWDLESGKSVRTLTGHTALVSAIAVTPDGRRAISASADHTLRIWDLVSGRSVRVLPGQTDLVSAIAITPDGRRVVWGSGAGALFVWDSDGGETVRILTGHPDWVTAVAVTPDGHRAISASASPTLQVWDLESGQLVRALSGHTDLINAVVLTPDGRHAISASADHTLRVWDLEGGNFVTAFSGEGPMLRCAVASDARTIVARDKSGRGHFLRLEGLD